MISLANLAKLDWKENWNQNKLNKIWYWFSIQRNAFQILFHDFSSFLPHLSHLDNTFNKNRWHAGFMLFLFLVSIYIIVGNFENFQHSMAYLLTSWTSLFFSIVRHQTESGSEMFLTFCCSLEKCCTAVTNSLVSRSNIDFI